jgi:hypothetical protein
LKELVDELPSFAARADGGRRVRRFNHGNILPQNY